MSRHLRTPDLEKKMFKPKDKLTKEDLKNIGTLAKDVMRQADMEIKHFSNALKTAMVNKATAEALIKRFK